MRYLDRYYIVFEPLKTVSAAEVAAVAARLGVRFPDGYAEYVTELGEGTLSTYLRVWMPQEVEDKLAEFRRLLFETFTWDRDGPLPPNRVRDVVTLGSTLDGDTLVFHPDRPDDLFVLPRHDDQIYQTGPGLEAAIDWLFDSDVLTNTKELRYFEPNGQRARIERTLPLPYPVVRDAVVGLGLHDHVAWEEPDEDEEKVFDAFIRVGNRYEEIDAEEASIMLLIRDIGGGVMVSTASLFKPDSSKVGIEYVAGCDRTKLDRLLRLLDELNPRGGKRKRGWW